MSGEPRVQTAPEPLRVAPVRTTELHCPDLDLSVTLTPERPADRHQRQVRFNVSPQRSGHSECDPVVATVIPEPSNNQSTVRKAQNKKKKGTESDKGRGRAMGGDSVVCDGQLTEGAELNTTLALRAELREVEELVFDPEKAVKEKLQNSTLTKNHISIKAAEGLNFPRSQHLYRALVSVSLPHDQLISQALQDRPALAPPTSSQTNKFSSQPLEGPDLLPFYSPDKLLREVPLLPGNHISLPRPRPVPRPAHTTFHLHHLHKLWES
ncbi:protein phosphatase 1 regulatory subunit 35 isoform X2 [Myxocyprinus asiaticus]|nr:protein phosphatase 1 regulatory subunit 35 isoform X2 [Myxocyprinus asiaticus]XP_051516654.1 protein phosphatase 1 regulatory subunit 35 isoform X2 [Myxocyprinus asiaticus]XP_051516655.1 protein phosphatase 1 regulatory subunit 35 isoform X2 [Myxocyprinus asiaticus]XP_051516656.1 protein phosphatase 1 regulatory subunit 35 isoform X2 [Myxocyprinus asiaticus]XP_051516657.1 protein phosphatase 1 regulatory subunit 35 isoform X2 [Myxocyprinus asiaticus]XP_051516658.1 protein phosphatase 1 reg